MQSTAPSSGATPILGYTQYADLGAQFSNSTNSAADIKKAAAHFESIFIDMWLKSARDATQVLAQDNPLSGGQMAMSEQMLDHEMAVHLSANGGIGLADVIVRQLSPNTNSLQNTTAPILVARPATPQPQPIQTTIAAKPNGVVQAQFSDAEDFISKLQPIFARAVKTVGLPLVAVLSQAALETGWGQHVIADAQGRSSNNLFGIKASSKQDSVSVTTREFEFGSWIEKNDQFRRYQSWAESVQDYVQKIANSDRYQAPFQARGDASKYVQALQSAGYATDPNYADKLINVMQRVKPLLSALVK